MPIDPNISLGVKPVDFLGSAGNYLNLARGVQALQQEQAMNPIQQEKARIELGILSGTQGATIAQRQAESGQAITAEQVARFNQAGSIEERLKANFAPLAQKRSFQNVTANPKAAIKDVMAAKQRAIAAGVPEDSAEFFAASIYSKIAEAQSLGDQTPVNEWMFRNLMSSQTPGALQQLTAPAGTPQVTFGGVPGSVVATPRGAQFVPTLITPPQPMPAQQMPQKGVQTGGAPLSTGIQARDLNLDLSETAPADKRGPGIPLMQPQAAAPAQPQGVTAEMMSARPAGAAGAMTMPALRYPVRTPGQAFLPAQGEEADRATGQKYVGDLVAMQPAMSTARRSIEEVIDKANKIQQQSYFQAGGPGAMERNVRAFFGSEDYKQLSKDLANVQIGMIQSKGGSLDTVSGQALARHANGDETYPPNVLKSIARRSYADVLATELEGRAAANFAHNFGDANHNAFKQVWSKNADSRIFEIMALPKLIQDKAERIKVANEILKNATPKEREEFNRKYQNILRLEQIGSL
jgi:hypothetical protein